MGEGRREGAGADTPGDILRLTVPEAANALGISPEAVRNRLSRGTLEGVKEGRSVFVLIDRGQVRPTSSIPTDTSGELIAELRRTNELLREVITTRGEEIRREQEAHAEARRIIAGLVQRIPELEAPSEERESPETVQEEPERTEPRSYAPGAQEAPQRPWWRRLIGGG